MRWKFSALAAAAALALPAMAHAQGAIEGSEHGAAVGAHDAGPVGAVVGGVVGGVTGGVAGLLGAPDYPRFHHYIVEQNIPSYRYDGRVQVGVILPDEEITYYDVPPDFHVAPGYRYTVVDNEPVIVDHSRRVVEVIN
jgi:hypothetical protein